MSKPSKPKPHRAIASRATVAERIDLIEGLMRRAAWQRGRSNRQLAAQWGVSVGTVDDYAAEAGRRVRAEVLDPDTVSETVSAALSTIVREALAEKDRRSVIQAADTWTRIVGARAPERHQDVPLSPEDEERVLAEAAAEYERRKAKKGA